MRITISPNISYKGLVEDFGIKGKDRVYQKDFDILTNEFVLTIPDPPETIRGIKVSDGARKKWISNKIRRALFKRLYNLIQANARLDINLLEEEDNPNSPPIKIYWEDDTALPGSLVYEEQSFKRWLKDNIDANFEILRASKDRTKSGRYIPSWAQKAEPMTWGQERVWYKAPPSIRYNTATFYKNESDNLSCGYDYLVNEFGKRRGYKKICKNKKTIDVAVSLPQKFHKDIYNEWLCLYQEEIRLNELIPQNIHYLPECVDIDTIQTDIFNVKEQAYKGDYNNNEIEESLSILDLIKWAIVSNTRIIVYDYDDTHYCSYNPNNFKQLHNDIKVGDNNTIVVKVKDNHAYFVMDRNLKISASKSDTNYELGGDTQPRSKEKNKEEKESKYHQHPIKLVDLDYQTIQELGGINENATYEEWKQLKWKALTEKQSDLLLNNPPPTMEQLLEWAGDSKNIHHYSVDKPSLNGLVNYIYKTQKVEYTDKNGKQLKPLTPKSMNGTAKSILSATYGSLKIYSNKRTPRTEDDGCEYEDLYELYPELKSEYGIIPTTTKIANEVFKSLNDDNIYSMFNKQTRRMFYDCECKPMNRALYEGKDKKDYSKYPVYSIDIKRAYTSALLNNDTLYQIYDSVSQPKSYKGDFNPNYFYLCYNRINEYPCKEGKGLILYHGSYLRNLLDKVIIKYYLEPKEELPADTFVPFVNKIKELTTDIGINPIKLTMEEKNHPDYVDNFKPAIISNIQDKELINCFVGDLKKKDGIKQYKHFITPSKITTQREIMRNKIPTRLKSDGLCWESESMLISTPYRTSSYKTGQPIRLAVIDLINEQIYKLWRHYRNCLYSSKFITNWTNNIKNRKLLQKIQDKKSIPGKISTKKRNYEPSVISIKTDALYISVPNQSAWITKTTTENYEKIEKRVMVASIYNDKFIKYVIESWNNNNDYKVDLENTIEWDELNNFVVNSQAQNSFKYIENKWKYDKDIDEEWKLNKDYDWKTKLLLEGGFIDGMGGVGKSELIIELKNRCIRNRAKYRWKKIYYSITKELNSYQLLQDWRDKNPCFMKTYCPTNKSANRLNLNRTDKQGEAKTLHKGLGIPFQEDKAFDENNVEIEVNTEIDYMEQIISTLQGRDFNSKNRKISPRFDIIFIDEVSMCGGNMLSYLCYIKMRIPGIRFVVSGDIPHQLPPVAEEYRPFYTCYTLKEITNFNKITLKYNFRSGISSQQLWDWSAEPHKFKEVKDAPLTYRNLCWTNKTRKEVIDKLQDTIINPQVIDTSKEFERDTDGDKHNRELKYGMGTPLIAMVGNSELGTSKNELYTITKTEPLTLYEPVLDKTIIIEDDVENTLKKNFLSGFCITIHKSQGETYDDKYTIYDWGKMSERRSYIHRRLRYVAQSRSTNPEKNIYYKY